jgi:teichuronic acid biosynthesis glycosyltransferase TuaG
MTNPRFTVVTALYKSTLYLEGLVACVQKQTVSDWELILVDDCSPDDTFEMAQAYAADDSRIRVFQTEKNAGAPATARNIGIREAKGEYITFLDHDDTIPQNKLARCHEYMEERKLDFLCTNGELFNAGEGKVDGNAIGEVLGTEDEITQHFARRLLEGNFVPPNSTLIRAEVFQRVGVFDETLKGVDDFDMWYRIARECRCGYLNEVLASWRYKNEQSISADDTKMIADEAKFYSKFSAQNPLALNGEKRAYKMLGNRYLAKGEYKEAAEYYAKSGSNKLAHISRFAGPVFRKLYLVRRQVKARGEFSPLTLDFRAV